MSRVFITGSADGLGLLAAQQLTADGHEVTLQAPGRSRGDEALERVSELGRRLLSSCAALTGVQLPN